MESLKKLLETIEDETLKKGAEKICEASLGVWVSKEDLVKIIKGLDERIKSCKGTETFYKALEDAGRTLLVEGLTKKIPALIDYSLKMYKLAMEYCPEAEKEYYQKAVKDVFKAALIARLE